MTVDDFYKNRDAIGIGTFIRMDQIVVLVIGSGDDDPCVAICDIYSGCIIGDFIEVADHGDLCFSECRKIFSGNVKRLEIISASAAASYVSESLKLLADSNDTGGEATNA